MTVAEKLRAARSLIADPAHWCTKFYASKADGTEAEIRAPEACRWCAEGALARIDNLDAGAFDLLSNIAVELYGHTTITVNDDEGHAAVLRVYDAAIAVAEKWGY